MGGGGTMIEIRPSLVFRKGLARVETPRCGNCIPKIGRWGDDVVAGGWCDNGDAEDPEHGNSARCHLASGEY